MQLERLPAARRPVEPVDVLREHAAHEAQALELRDRDVPLVRPSLPEPGDALGVEVPELLRLAAPRVDVRELLEALGAPEALAAAVVGKAALRRDAGPGEDQHVPGVADELGEQVELAVRAVTHSVTVAAAARGRPGRFDRV